jgi:hypothetical protein
VLPRLDDLRPSTGDGPTVLQWIVGALSIAIFVVAYIGPRRVSSALSCANAVARPSLRSNPYDLDLIKALVGCDVPQLVAACPRLRPKNAGNEYQAAYQADLRDVDVFWIGETEWFVEVVRGRVACVRMMKG